MKNKIKKTISMLLTVSIICSMLLLTGASEEPIQAEPIEIEPISGETEERLTITDVLNILKDLAGIKSLTTEQIERYDFYGNGNITITNALFILKELAGIGNAKDIPTQFEPGDRIEFDSLEAFRELRDMMNSSTDKQLQDYLDKNSYSYNGLMNRGDVKRFIDSVSDVYIPVLKDEALSKQLPLTYFVINPVSERMSIGHGNSGEKYILSRSFYNQRNAKEEILLTQKEQPELELKFISVDKNGIEYYSYECGRNKVISFFIVVDNYIFTVAVSNYKTQEEALKDIQSFTFKKLGEI